MAVECSGYHARSMAPPESDAPKPPPPPGARAAAPHRADADAAGVRAEPPLSRLALVSFVLSLLTCLPFAMAGIITGAIASHRIRTSQGRLRGLPLALAAMIIGAVMMIGQAVLMEWTAGEFMSRNDAAVRTLTAEVFEAIDEDRARSVERGWSVDATDRAGRAAILSFASEARDRYGLLRSVELIGTEAEGRDFARQVVTSAVVYRFEQAERTGSVRTVLTAEAGSFFPRARLVEIVVEDRERGDLRVGPQLPPASESPSSAPSAPSAPSAAPAAEETNAS
jgi:hypothetical protein